MKVSFAVALLAVFAFVAAPTAQGGIDGNWAIVFDTPMGAMDATASFKSAGEELSGTLESQAGSTTFKGTIKANAINFTMNVNTPQGDIAITMAGELEGDAIKGTFDFGQGTGAWTAKRMK
ncbi:MAG: hypothetical protein M3478_03410 [Planctomycetota bacterium]|nr:hypothetical protein [Planctomycetota bacterium]